MPWWVALILGVVGLAIAALYVRGLVWIFTKSRYTLAEMLGANIVAVASTLALYFAFQGLGLSGPNPPVEGVLIMMVPGYTFTLMASGFAWKEMLQRNLTAQRERLRVMCYHWACLIGAFLAPFLTVLFFAR